MDKEFPQLRTVKSPGSILHGLRRESYDRPTPSGEEQKQSVSMYHFFKKLIPDHLSLHHYNNKKVSLFPKNDMRRRILPTLICLSFLALRLTQKGIDWGGERDIMIDYSLE